MAGSSAGSPEYLAETNDPGLDQRVSIAFIVIDTFFLLVFYVSRYFNPKAVGVPMLVCNTLCYVLCMGSAATGICESFPPVSSHGLWALQGPFENNIEVGAWSISQCLERKSQTRSCDGLRQYGKIRSANDGY